MFVFCFEKEEIPGFAAIGGSGYYTDLLRTEEEEQRLREAQACVNGILNDDESVEQATYELSKNEIEDNDDDYEEERENLNHEQDNDEDYEERENSNCEQDNGNEEQSEEELQMIDSDIEVEPH